MMVEKEDLGLSLSLTSTQNHHSLHLNLMPSLVPSSGFNPRPSWNETFPSSGALMDFVKFAWLSFLDLGFAHNTRFKEAIFAFFFQLSRNLDKNNTFFFSSFALLSLISLTTNFSLIRVSQIYNLFTSHGVLFFRSVHQNSIFFIDSNSQSHMQIETLKHAEPRLDLSYEAST